ncbi:MAG: hypothetical protein ACRDZZ_04150 [Ilumatobacteraceae bacterium]
MSDDRQRRNRESDDDERRKGERRARADRSGVDRSGVDRSGERDADPLSKADPALRQALDGAPDATVRAILVLRDPHAGEQSATRGGAPADLGDLGEPGEPDEPDPDDYADRRSWRVAKIEAQRQVNERRYGSVLADMRTRGLELVGGTVTPVVVVTGEAAAVRDALRHDAVASATFEPLTGGADDAPT